jgi:CxxC-x17-CxxC domain-containing protein
MAYGEGGRGGGNFRRPMGPREEFDATCADCGQTCKVPFKPGLDKEGKPRPVYCQECYRKRKSTSFD